MIDQVMVVVVVHCYGYEVAVVALVKYVCCTWVELCKCWHRYHHYSESLSHITF